MNTRLIISALFVILATSEFGTAGEKRDCPKPWQSTSKESNCEWVQFQTEVRYPVSETTKILKPVSITAEVRVGYIQEDTSVEFRGNILYFEGLADSMVNHAPLFSALSSAGFRVIAFDYMGQGGSTGDMNDTRMDDILKLGFQVYSKLARPDERKPVVMGWSTGGLAAYMAASKGVARAAILLAPGIAPNLLVGTQDLLRFKFNQITLESLTSVVYTADMVNPHVDPIFPDSPFKVPDFGLDLVLTSKIARVTKIKKDIPGIVFQGRNDSYVSHLKNKWHLKLTAPHFVFKSFPGGRHEIDNEAESIATSVRQEALKFLGNL